MNFCQKTDTAAKGPGKTLSKQKTQQEKSYEVWWFEWEIPPSAWSLQVVALIGEVMKILGKAALLEELLHSGRPSTVL